MIDSGLVGTRRAEETQGTPTQSHISPSILVYEDKAPYIRRATLLKGEARNLQLRKQVSSLVDRRGLFVACSQARERNVKRLRGGLVFKAHRLLYHSTLGLRVIQNKVFAGQGENLQLLGGTFKPHRRVYHSTLGLRVIKKKKERTCNSWAVRLRLIDVCIIEL